MRRFFATHRPKDLHLDAEIEFHFQQAMEEKLAAGLPLDEARRQAALEFGGREQVKEELRDVYRWATLDQFASYIGSGLRLIRQAPSFSMAVILTLALGVGANSLVFSAINAILLRPLSFPHGDELLLLEQRASTRESFGGFVAPVRLEEWNQRNQTFQSISGWYRADVTESSGEIPEKLTEALVAPRFLKTWKIQPVAGRDFTKEEEHFGGPHAALISYRLWQRRFGSRYEALGKRINLDGSRYSIVGVLPETFAFPVHETDVWVTSPPDAPYAQSRSSTWFTAIGRMRPGVGLEQAQADLGRVQEALGRQYARTDSELRVRARALKETTVGTAGQSLWILFGAVSLLLVTACSNVAALLMARVAGRSREIAVRFAVGASRRSVVMQLLVECLVLAVIGSALALCLLAAGIGWLRSLSASLPRAQEISIDWHIVVYTLASSLLVTLLSGLLPALRGTRASLADDLAADSRTQVTGRSPFQWALVGMQVALAAILLVGAGLFARSLDALGRVHPGFDADRVLVLRVTGNWGETVNYDKLTARIDQTAEAFRQLPGVQSVATSLNLPGVPGEAKAEMRIVGESETRKSVFADNRIVSDTYFALLRIPLLQGQSCQKSRSGTIPDAAVNVAFAKAFFGGRSPLGHRVQMSSAQYSGMQSTIRGVVGDAREQGVEHEPVPTVYWCSNAPNPTPYLLVRTAGDPMRSVATLRRTLAKLDPSRSIYDVALLRDRIRETSAEERMRARVLALFAGTSLLLVCVGLYGTLSFLVATRRREIGLRFALGAVRGQIIRLFILKGTSVCLAGATVGLAGAAMLTRLLHSVLFGISDLDPVTFGGVAAVLLTVALAATLIPAVRAGALEPMQVLRDE